MRGGSAGEGRSVGRALLRRTRAGKERGAERLGPGGAIGASLHGRLCWAPLLLQGGQTADPSPGWKASSLAVLAAPAASESRFALWEGG